MEERERERKAWMDEPPASHTHHSMALGDCFVCVPCSQWALERGRAFHHMVLIFHTSLGNPIALNELG